MNVNVNKKSSWSNKSKAERVMIIYNWIRFILLIILMLALYILLNQYE